MINNTIIGIYSQNNILEMQIQVLIRTNFEYNGVVKQVYFKFCL